MHYLSIGRFLILVIFLTIASYEFKRYGRNRNTQRLYLIPYLILTVSEIAILLYSYIFYTVDSFNDYPIRMYFELLALLSLSFAANYNYNSVNKVSLNRSYFLYGLSLIFVFVLSIVFSEEIAKFIIYGMLTILFIKFVINSMDKIDKSFKTQELFFIGLALILFLADVFMRFVVDYSRIILLFAYAGITAPVLTYIIRTNDALLERKLALKKHEMEVFADLTDSLNSTFDRDKLLEKFVHEISEVMGASSAALYLVSKKDETILECNAFHGFYPPPKPVDERVATKIAFLRTTLFSMPVKRGEGNLGRVADEKRGMLQVNLHKDKSFQQTIAKVVLVKTLITIPLIREGAFYGVLQLVNRLDDEDLSRVGDDNFSEDDYRFVKMVVEQVSLAVYNAHIFKEMKIKQDTDADLKAARQIQLSLIPKTIPEEKTLDIHAIFSPTKAIGGDYYDFIKIDEDHYGVIIADVSGKGVTGGLVMTVTRTMMHMIAKKTYSPKEVLLELNTGIEIAVKEKHMFVTAMYCIFNVKEKTLKVCRAGHNPLVICKGATGKIETYKPNGLALGIIDSSTFGTITEEIEIPYENDDVIFLYTDGLTEEWNKDGSEMYGEAKMEAFIQKNRHDNSYTLVQKIFSDLENYRGGNAQHDDIAIISMKVV